MLCCSCLEHMMIPAACRQLCCQFDCCTLRNILYLIPASPEAEPTADPVAKAATCLHDHARHCWQQAGNMLMPPEPTPADFSRVFDSFHAANSLSALCQSAWQALRHLPLRRHPQENVTAVLWRSSVISMYMMHCYCGLLAETYKFLLQ